MVDSMTVFDTLLKNGSLKPRSFPCLTPLLKESP